MRFFSLSRCLLTLEAPGLNAEFEQVEKAFRAALRPWIRRGILDGRALGWEKWDEGQVKLD